MGRFLRNSELRPSSRRYEAVMMKPKKMKTKMMKVSPRTGGLDLQPHKIPTQTEDEMRMHHFVTFSLRLVVL